MSVAPEYDTIDLPTSTTIVITQPLEITHSVDIVGNNATLLFSQGNTAAWPAAASGAIYVDAAPYTNIQLELNNFTIRFDPSSPIRWSNPSSSEPALFDPENNPGGISHAVIDSRDSNTNANDTILTLNGMTISGPPAFDASSYSSLQTQLAASGDTTHQYVGEQDLELIRTNDQDSGTISNSTFQGGTITVFGGPWNITGNTVRGSTADTYSPSAFSLHSPHDVVLDDNAVSSPSPMDANSAWSISRFQGSTTSSRTIHSAATPDRSAMNSLMTEGAASTSESMIPRSWWRRVATTYFSRADPARSRRMDNFWCFRI